MGNPTVKAWVATIAFSLVGLWTFFYRAPIVPELLPQAIFYAVLVLNTFVSIRFYAKLQPRNSSQLIIDMVLVVTYTALALALGRPLSFALLVLALFVCAPIKYVLMLGQIPHTTLLLRKIKIDASGTALCARFLYATIAGYALLSAWVLAILFALANIYLLLIRPMYRL